MRYISHIANLVLLTNGGNIGRDSSSKRAYSFGLHGELVIGSLTTNSGAGNYIDAGLQSNTDDQLQLIYPTDLDGNAVTRLEMAGLGTLTGVTLTSGAVSPLSAGHRLFFEAPTLTSTSDSVPATAGIWYKVLTGTTIYDGTTYVAGQRFETDGTTTATTGTGTFRLDIPPELKKTCENKAAVDGVFAYKILYKGNESDSYWEYSEAGAEPKDATDSTATDYYGWTE